jgi:hypothetical protein
MKAIPYSELLQEVCDLVGWDPANLSAQEFRQARRAIGNAIGKCWRYTFWADLVRTEQRTFHPQYDDTEEVEEGEFRYFPPTDSYYQALTITTGNPPANLVGEEWVTDLDYWSLASRTLKLRTWNAVTTYAKGDQVYSATTFKNYQAWDDPPLGTAPTDTDYWSEITELDPVVPWTEAGFNPIGLVEGVYARNPKTHRGAPEVPWDETSDGLQIRDPDINAPWIRYQLRVPILTGETWDSGTAYDAVALEDGITVTPPVARGDYTAFETVGEARAATILATRVDVLRDGNQDAAFFWRDPTYVDDGLDVTGFVDAAGTAFRRRQRV